VGYGDPTAITIDEPEPQPEPEPETRLGQDWPEVTEADDPSDTEVRQGPRSTEAQDSIDEETKAWIAGSDRRGVIYSLTKPLATTAGRLIHEPIRLTAEPGPTDAGAPVRNQDGEIVGLVAHSSLPQVAAVPIDRVTEVVGWLQEIGVGDPSWLGLTVMSQPSGVVVTTVDSTGPSTALIPGDIIVAVDGQAVQHPDGLWFAARQVGPGGVLEVTVRGQNQRQSTVVEIVVGTVPAP
ncbi:MAG: PDZ domain-containing protein, partial [Actinomycetota bacterium]